jgi:hypothetical protein
MERRATPDGQEATVARDNPEQAPGKDRVLGEGEHHVIKDEDGTPVAVRFPESLPSAATEPARKRPIRRLLGRRKPEEPPPRTAEEMLSVEDGIVTSVSAPRSSGEAAIAAAAIGSPSFNFETNEVTGLVGLEADLEKARNAIRVSQLKAAGYGVTVGSNGAPVAIQFPERPNYTDKLFMRSDINLWLTLGRDGQLAAKVADSPRAVRAAMFRAAGMLDKKETVLLAWLAGDPERKEDLSGDEVPITGVDAERILQISPAVNNAMSDNPVLAARSAVSVSRAIMNAERFMAKKKKEGPGNGAKICG